jgi:type IV secretory pathway TraG/TraD family ATPase VirD4
VRETKHGALFIPYTAGQIAALRSMISAWVRLGIFEAMNRDEQDQRLWFVVDELDALGEIDGLKDALARLRKFGGRCVLGFQSIAQVSGTYGRGAAETIVENCANTLILRCSASEHGGTSEFASKLIGQREVVHTTHSSTGQPDRWLSSTTRSELLRIEPAVMASQIERLADLQGFLKVASIPDWQRVTLTRRDEPHESARRRSKAPSDAGLGVSAAMAGNAMPAEPVVEKGTMPHSPPGENVPSANGGVRRRGRRVASEPSKVYAAKRPTAPRGGKTPSARGGPENMADNQPGDRPTQ